MIRLVEMGVPNYLVASSLTLSMAQRLVRKPCTECVGYVALLEPEHIGKRVWLQRVGQEPEGPFLVIDCATAAHRAALIERGWAVDVDYQTAQRWQMRGPIWVRVLTEN